MTFETILTKGAKQTRAEKIALNKEAVFGGLPRIDDVNKQLSSIGAPLTMRTGEDIFKKEVKIKKSSRGAKLSLETYKQYQGEFYEDLRDFQLRIQRLKVRVLGYFLTGSLRHWDSKDPSYRERENPLAGHLINLASAYRHGKKTLDEQGQQELVAGFNRFLPEEGQLTALPNISTFDAEQLYDLSFGLAYGELPDEKERKILENVLEQINQIEQKIQDIQEQGAQGDTSEKQLRSLWDEYRRLLKQIASYEELDSWFSPTYGSSGKGQRGKEQASEPFRTDYQRCLMKEAEALERGLNRSYFKESDYSEHVESFLFNNGMNALEAIYMLLEDELAKILNKTRQGEQLPVGPVFKTKDIYYEVDDSIKQYFSKFAIKPEEFEPQDTSSLIKRIKQDLPMAVFLNPMSNMYDMRITSITEILEALADKDWQNKVDKEIYGESDYRIAKRGIYIIIDNSTVGRLAKWKNFDFRRLPKFVRVLSFESLVKYAQDGQELVQAGLVTAIGEYLGSEVDRARRSHGFMPPENTVRKLAAAIPTDLTDKKMERHFRNSSFLAGEILKEIKKRGKASFIGEVIFPGLPSHPQYQEAQQELSAGGGLFNIGLDFHFLADYKKRVGRNDAYSLSQKDFNQQNDFLARAFLDLVTIIAKQAGVEINKGTSYGFHTTRVANYQRKANEGEFLDVKDPTKPSVHYIRVAVGTENVKDATLLADVIIRANEIFSQAIRDEKVFTLAELILARPGDREISFG